MLALDTLLLCLSLIPGAVIIATFLAAARRLHPDAVHLIILLSAGMVGFSLMGIVTLIATLEPTRIIWPLLSAVVWVGALTLAWRNENNPARNA